jgi:formylglycine-generating enzyme required for sulfatase activity
MRPPRRRFSLGTSLGGLGALCGLLLPGCGSNVDPSAGPKVTKPIAGMVVVRSGGHSFQQGSSSAWAAPNEAPVLENHFTYDFQMDTTEVTQGRYREWMGRNPVSEPGLYGRGDAFPVYNVSWHDAVLFCNARSKASGMDTVYAYARADQAPGGSVYNLAGLTVRLDIRGFRLPTEAEWEYADGAEPGADFYWGRMADSSRTREFAWFSGNAKGATHPECPGPLRYGRKRDGVGQRLEGPLSFDGKRGFRRSPGSGSRIRYPRKGRRIQFRTA